MKVKHCGPSALWSFGTVRCYMASLVCITLDTISKRGLLIRPASNHQLQAVLGEEVNILAPYQTIHFVCGSFQSLSTVKSRSNRLLGSRKDVDCEGLGGVGI